MPLLSIAGTATCHRADGQQQEQGTRCKRPQARRREEKGLEPDGSRGNSRVVGHLHIVKKRDESSKKKAFDRRTPTDGYDRPVISWPMSQ